MKSLVGPEHQVHVLVARSPATNEQSGHMEECRRPLRALGSPLALPGP